MGRERKLDGTRLQRSAASLDVAVPPFPPPPTVNLAARLVRRSGPSTSAGSGDRWVREGRASTTNSSSRAGTRDRAADGSTRRRRPRSRGWQRGEGGGEWDRSSGVWGGGMNTAWLSGGGVGADGDGGMGSGGMGGGEQGSMSVEIRGASSQSGLGVQVHSGDDDMRAAGADGRGRRRDGVGMGGVGGGGLLTIPRGRVLGTHWVSSGDTEEDDLVTVQQFVRRRLRGDRYGACRRARPHVGARACSHSSDTAAKHAVQRVHAQHVLAHRNISTYYLLLSACCLLLITHGFLLPQNWQALRVFHAVTRLSR